MHFGRQNKCLSKCIKLYFTQNDNSNKKNMCAYQKFSDPLPETHFFWPYEPLDGLYFIGTAETDGLNFMTLTYFSRSPGSYNSVKKPCLHSI